jgi:hypothetical protein
MMEDTGKGQCFVGKRPWTSTVEDAYIRHNLLENSEASQANIAKYNTSLDNLSKVEAKLASAGERASAAEKALGSLAGTASPATLQETQDMLNLLQGQISKLESASCAILNLGSAAFDSHTRASALAIQLKITQDLLQQKESERTLKTQEFMSAEVDLVASLQRTIHEQKEKFERLERASEADIAKYNTLLDNLRKVEAKLVAAEERASAAGRALGGLPDTGGLADTAASASELAIQLKNTHDQLKNAQDLHQQKESEPTLKLKNLFPQMTIWWLRSREPFTSRRRRSKVWRELYQRTLVQHHRWLKARLMRLHLPLVHRLPVKQISPSTTHYWIS